MADEFDPLKQTDNKPVEELYATVKKNTSPNDDDLLRPQYESVVRKEHNQIDTPTEQQPKGEIYNKLDFTSNASKAPVRSSNPFSEDVQKSPPSSQGFPQIPKEPTTITKKPEQRAGQYWEDSESCHNKEYETGPPPAYYPEEYYEDETAYKKKGLSATIDRIVQRFPALGIFYKPSSAASSEHYETEQGHEYVEGDIEGNEAPQLVDATTLSRELTADEIALSGRYSNKLRTQMIDLQKKDQTKPVDVCIHHDTYTIYSCDVGRSIVEIFDMYGKLHHVIDDQTTLKFQPTTIAVAYDGTIIVASHFSHRLHMYAPIDSPENEQNNPDETVHDGYRFQQYKLGAPGHGIHEFHHPAGIAIDYSDGYLYVCDRGNYRIQVMRPEGVCERVIELISRDQEVSHISPIQIAHQQHRGQIVCIIGEGDAICFIPKYADGRTNVEPLYILDNDGLELLGASGIAVDSDDRIFISDTGHNRIVICTPEGGYIGHFGVEGSGPGELKQPCGLDITADGTLVVADSGNKRLQLFGSIRERTVEEKKPPVEKPDDKNNLLVDAGHNAI